MVAPLGVNNLVPFAAMGVLLIAFDVWSLRVSTDDRDAWQEGHDKVMRPMAPVCILASVILTLAGVVSATS